MQGVDKKHITLNTFSFFFSFFWVSHFVFVVNIGPDPIFLVMIEVLNMLKIVQCLALIFAVGLVEDELRMFSY